LCQNNPTVTLSPSAIIKNDRKFIEDDNRGKYISVTELLDPLTEEALDGIEQFSHAKIIFYFDKLGEGSVE